MTSGAKSMAVSASRISFISRLRMSIAARRARSWFGRGPWQNAHGVVVAQNIDDLRSPNNNINQQTTIIETGETLNGMFERSNKHDILTGSQADGRAFPGNLSLTCNNWTSSTFGVAMLGHHDRCSRGALPVNWFK